MQWLPRVIRYGWALPVTFLGALLALLALIGGGRARVHQGVWEASGGWPGRRLLGGLPFAGTVAAITLGHVVIGVNEAAIRSTRNHERVHVRQYERWGVLFLVAYPLAGLWVWVTGRNPYWDNPFEVAARRGEAERLSRPSGG